MITTVHVKGAALEDVAALVEAQLAGEGYEVGEAEEPASVLDTSVREIVLAAQGAFVSVLDHPYADTAWGELLSAGLGLPVLTLSGECDHAFFSDATIHVDGEVAGESKVPADAVLGDDGRHRITPTFLAAITPEAAGALAAGVVVSELGGEENLVTLGELLGIPRPLVRSLWDGSVGPDDRRIVFRRVAGAAARPALDLASLFAGLTAKLGEEDQAQLAAMMAYEPSAEEQAALPRLFVQPGAMQDLFAGTEDGWIGVDVSLSSLLPSAEGLTIELEGPGLDLLGLGGEAEVGDARFPIVDRRISLPGVTLASSRPAGRGLLAGAMNVGFVDERARTYVRIPAALRGPGAGAISFTVRTTVPDDVVETATLDLAIGSRPRRPVLPAGGHERHVRDLERYASHDAILGWVAFGAPWADLASRVTPMLHDLAMVLRRVAPMPLTDVNVMTASQESLAFPDALRRPEVWAKVEAELMRGARVSVDAWDDSGMCNPDERIDVTLELAHHKDGAHPGWPARDVAGDPIDLPRVVLAWSITTPRSAEHRALVAEVSRSVVLNAGHVPGNLGGFVQTGEMGGGTTGSTPYEDMVGERRPQQARLERHVRTPAWCVLVPRAAAEKLGEARSPRLRTMRTTHGLFAWATATDPIAWTDDDREAMERFLLPTM